MASTFKNMNFFDIICLLLNQIKQSEHYSADMSDSSIGIDTRITIILADQLNYAIKKVNTIMHAANKSENHLLYDYYGIYISYDAPESNISKLLYGCPYNYFTTEILFDNFLAYYCFHMMLRTLVFVANLTFEVESKKFLSHCIVNLYQRTSGVNPGTCLDINKIIMEENSISDMIGIQMIFLDAEHLVNIAYSRNDTIEIVYHRYQDPLNDPLVICRRLFGLVNSQRLFFDVYAYNRISRISILKQTDNYIFVSIELAFNFRLRLALFEILYKLDTLPHNAYLYARSIFGKKIAYIRKHVDRIVIFRNAEDGNKAFIYTYRDFLLKLKNLLDTNNFSGIGAYKFARILYNLLLNDDPVIVLKCSSIYFYHGFNASIIFEDVLQTFTNAAQE